MIELPVCRMSDRATVPTKAHIHDAGWDLYAADEYQVSPGKHQTISTDVCMAIPHGYYGRIAPRSGLAANRGIDILAGVVDSGYRDEIRVVLINLGDMVFCISPGDRIAQMVIEVAPSTALTEVDTLPESDGRGVNGFGSSGVSPLENVDLILNQEEGTCHE